MELKNFITIYDNALPIQVIGNLIRYANKNNFNKTCVGMDNQENFDIRKA